uniref:Uncharacterized protein n=1 Tax=Heterorhabditis bacteriophora TaxID=37862 RepID=A0A1I7WYF4_HETBA
MLIQRFGCPIASSSVSRLIILLRHNSSLPDLRSILIESLKSKFDIRHIQIEKPKYRVFVRDSTFHSMSLDDQHKLVMDTLQVDIRYDFIQQLY